MATPLPEVGTGVTSTRLGDYHLAVRDLFGGNTFQPALFLLAAVISGDPVLPAAQHTDIYLTALGVVLITSVYVAGLVFRPRRPYLRMVSTVSPSCSCPPRASRASPPSALELEAGVRVVLCVPSGWVCVAARASYLGDAHSWGAGVPGRRAAPIA